MLDERFGEKQLWWPKFFIISGIRANGFQNFDKNFRAGWSQPHSACPDEIFFYFLKERNEGKNTSFWKLRIAIIFKLWAKNIFSTFAGMVTAGLSKNRCTCSDEDFYNEISRRALYFSSFPEIQQKFFRVLTRKFRQGGHNYFYTCT